jgi:hypothetical protein
MYASDLMGSGKFLLLGDAGGCIAFEVWNVSPLIQISPRYTLSSSFRSCGFISCDKDSVILTVRERGADVFRLVEVNCQQDAPIVSVLDKEIPAGEGPSPICRAGLCVFSDVADRKRLHMFMLGDSSEKPEVCIDYSQEVLGYEMDRQGRLLVVWHPGGQVTLRSINFPDSEVLMEARLVFSGDDLVLEKIGK